MKTSHLRLIVILMVLVSAFSLTSCKNTGSECVTINEEGAR
jgi:predicted small secreted protein